MELPFRIENRDSFRVVGYLLHTTNRQGAGKKSIPLYWSELKENHLVKPLCSLAEQELNGLFGINIYNIDESDSRKFDYMVAVSSECGIRDGLNGYTVPARTWAVFPCTMETMGKTQVQAITKWLPRSKYRPLNKGYLTGRMKSGAPDIEYYGGNGEVEIWVAVEEK